MSTSPFRAVLISNKQNSSDSSPHYLNHNPTSRGEILFSFPPFLLLSLPPILPFFLDTPNSSCSSCVQDLLLTLCSGSLQAGLGTTCGAGDQTQEGRKWMTLWMPHQLCAFYPSYPESLCPETEINESLQQYCQDDYTIFGRVDLHHPGMPRGFSWLCALGSFWQCPGHKLWVEVESAKCRASVLSPVSICPAHVQHLLIKHVKGWMLEWKVKEKARELYWVGESLYWVT